MKMYKRIVLRLERQKIQIQVIGQPEALTDDAVLAVNLTTRKVVGVGSSALNWRGMADFQMVWPFEHPRVIVDDWDAARILITKLLAKHCSKSILKPEIVFQVTVPLEGGLSPVERRALLQLLEAAGARLGAVFEGDMTLSPEMLDELFRSSQATGTAVPTTYIP